MLLPKEFTTLVGECPYVRSWLGKCGERCKGRRIPRGVRGAFVVVRCRNASGSSPKSRTFSKTCVSVDGRASGQGELVGEGWERSKFSSGHPSMPQMMVTGRFDGVLCMSNSPKEDWPEADTKDSFRDIETTEGADCSELARVRPTPRLVRRFCLCISKDRSTKP